MVKISLIASSVRCWLWDEFFKSLEGNNEYEVVFTGNLSTYQVRPYLNKYPMLKYIHTEDCICPTQCYEIARRFSSGELIMWVADDCEFSYMLLDNVYEFYNSLLPKSLISIKTKENSQNTDLDEHRFFGFNRETPLMAPLGVISSEYLNYLGGFDRRYLCGQYENKTAMMVYEDGGQVVKYEKGYVAIEHLKKHGQGTKFWKGYEGDREILEADYAIGEKEIPQVAEKCYGAKVKLNGLQPPTISWPQWIDNRKVSMKSQTGFLPYSDKNLLTISQCHRKWPIDE